MNGMLRTLCFLCLFLSPLASCGGKRAVRVDVQRVEVTLDAGFRVFIEIRPRYKATFYGLAGDLLVNGRSTPYAVKGLEKGDVLRARESREILVLIRPGLDQVGLGLVRGLIGQATKVEFDGRAVVEILGRKRTVPVRIEKSVAP